MEDEQLQKLIAAGIAFVSIHPRSEAEIRVYLEKRAKRMKLVETAVVEALERLRELHLVDDTAYARLFVESRMRSRPRGERRIRLELRAKGVQSEIVDRVCGECFTEQDGQKTEVVLARQVASKKLRIWGTLPERERKQKLFRYLLGRGFSSETIQTIIDECRDIHYNRGN